ncbi:MAG: hypothetical protein QW356_05795 [Candidatus Hadarchaeales archaeon]
MRAYQLAMALVAFQFSIAVVNALMPGLFTAERMSFWAGWSDWKTMVATAAGGLTLLASVVLKLNIGATVFAAVFWVSNIPMSATLNALQGYGILPATLNVAMQGLAWLCFIFAFAQMSGGAGKVMY